ncbi:acyl-CoA thioesterase [Thermaerobacillus caldiproteolyticus]|uniref:Acyl-CoA thioester hydrolase n=1 Tax=Thermaerobacillus caldiproteolyticus TaxID=247480 RepID=A0A7V9Z465_9BACL|nr:thioesterase family protein [Anoxybacillus caldiproteolyticus]MBA2873709.1 acyl-CoA thioester hydrolase [Anoxybacillus caldiproteolyticus]QPA30279.1 acyl-CoA thioesterase [Anoxybacillus caldiproteolyticus]
MKNIDYIGNMEEWQQSFTFFHRIKVRFCETDMFGHLNNTVPFIYFEEVRTEFLKRIGFMGQWTSAQSEEIPVVADLKCDFLQQVFFNDELYVYVKVHQIGRSSVDFHYMAKRDNKEIVFVGRGALVQINKRTGRSVPWNEEMRQRLQQSQVVSFF